MPQLTESDAGRLAPEQAAELVGVLDLQARWDALLGVRGESPDHAALHARQRSHEAWQAALRGYAGRYRNAPVPEPTQAMPDRLAAWCRTLRAVFRRAAGGDPARVMAKVYRLADRVAERVGTEPVGRAPADDLAGAARELDTVVAWCDGLATPPAPPGDRLKG